MLLMVFRLMVFKQIVYTKILLGWDCNVKKGNPFNVKQLATAGVQWRKVVVYNLMILEFLAFIISEMNRSITFFKRLLKYFSWAKLDSPWRHFRPQKLVLFRMPTDLKSSWPSQPFHAFNCIVIFFHNIGYLGYTVYFKYQLVTRFFFSVICWS